jgi:ABC-type nitrate/sulfonate/bicarbonate transport system substrate-binding protein
MRLNTLLIFLSLTLVVTVNSPSVASAEGTALTTVTLQLKWLHQFQFAGYYAAIEQGFYHDAGLKVILKEARPGLNITNELTSGRADYLINNPSALLGRAEGKPLIALAAIFQHSPLVMISLKESQIMTPADMVDRRVMFTPEVGLKRNRSTTTRYINM